MSTKKRQIADTYPLSPMQEGMLFHSLYAPESGLYVTQVACTLEHLRVAALEHAWQQVVERHPMLRTAFVWRRLEKPLQVVGQTVKVPWEQQDWRGLSAAAQEERFTAYLQADRRRGFKLSSAPLMRLALFQVAEETYRFVWSHHHILLDGWSVHALLKEVFTCYEAHCHGLPAHLPPSRPYRDYIAWLHQQDMTEAARVWRQTLQGFTAPTSLGLDQAHGGVTEQKADYGEQRRRLSRATTTALRRLARQYQLTLNTLVQGAWALLLSRYSGEDDVVFGAVVSGRPGDLPGVEAMVGLFINTLPVRVQVAPEAALLPWLQQLQAQQAEMRRYEYSPLVQVQGWSDVPRGLPLFETLYVFESYPVQAPDTERDVSLEVRDYQVVERENYPLALVVGPGEELTLKLLYDGQRFGNATIARLLRQVQSVLESFVARPLQRVSDVTLLTAAERQQMLVEWNATATDYPQEESLQALFEAQVERHPEAIAGVYDDQHLTYQELNRRANGLAHYLQRLGVGPAVLVGLCVERSLEMLIGVLGILKAGGAYVPLDPTYPAARLAFMVADARTPVLLTQARLQGGLATHGAQVVCLDADWEVIAQQSQANPVHTTTAQHLAYVMYTSGSTGTPKGICVPQRAINRLVCNTNYVQVGPDDRIAQASNASFDAATFEIWGALLHGARLVGITKEVALSPHDFAGQLLEQGISTLFVTTALFNQLARDVPSAFQPLQHLLFGGEAVDPQWVNEVLTHAPPRRLLHVYGPTESTTFATWYLVQDVPAGATTVPIGGPLSNTQLYVLDRALHPVPVGMAGELYIGGAGLALGYWQRPELTAERFVPHPFSSEPGARLYRTGDLVRYQGPGQLVFLGRIDQQVKLRGFRIELAEIEAALARHPAVQDVIVVLREEIPGEKRLVAYVVPDPAQRPTDRELRHFVQQKLPEYMVPAAVVLLDTLPLTPNGKVDRQALPAPERTRAASEDAMMAPRTPVEEVLAGIWSRVLDVDQVSLGDNFFDLGGHSLLATQVISRLREALQVELPLRHLFEAPTLASLAERVETARRAESGLPTQPITPASRDGALPLSFGQQRLWFLDQLAPGNPAYNFHAGLRLVGQLDVAALERACSEIVRRHEVLRTIFATADGQPVQVITPAQALRLPLVDLQAVSVTQREAAVRQLAAEEAQHPFDLARGPLLRVRLLRLDEAEHVALVTMHHIVCDGWSMGVFVRECAALYSAFTNGHAAALPTLPLQYADVAAWQQQWLQGEGLQTHLTYWRRQLAGLPVLQLPTDRPRPPLPTFQGARQALLLPADLVTALHTLSRREGVTLFMTLLAAFQSLLCRYTGQDDIVVGTDIANRNRGETEDLIGFFTNQLVLRTDLSGNPTFRDLLRRVREVALGAYAHQDLPFDKLVEVLQPERDSSRNPLFQVMFILQNAPVSTLELPGLRLSPLPVEQETTAFDITLSFAAAAQGQMHMACRYNTDLFHASTMARMLEHMGTLLRSVVAQPEVRLNTLDIRSETEKHQQAIAYMERKESKFSKLTAIKPKAVSLSQEALITTSYLQPGQRLPLVVRPGVEGLELSTWAQSHRDFIEAQLDTHGGMLFRDFQVKSLAQFEQVAKIVSPALMEYGERSSPRTQISGAVYTSTEHPADQYMLLHNEQSYTLNWPMKIWFFCSQAAQQGGRTPIADSRNIYRRLDPQLIETFARKQVMYVRNYGDGLGLPWQEVFQTSDRAMVEEHCRQASIAFEWKDHNRLRTRQVRPAIRTHPHTGEKVWFNHALFFHISSVEATTRASLLAGLDEAELPFNTCYGDGSPFEPAVLEALREAYQQETLSFPWQEGDILLLDNMLVAHGREPFVGPRKIVVAMAEPCTNAMQEI